MSLAQHQSTHCTISSFKFHDSVLYTATSLIPPLPPIYLERKLYLLIFNTKLNILILNKKKNLEILSWLRCTSLILFIPNDSQVLCGSKKKNLHYEKTHTYLPVILLQIVQCIVQNYLMPLKLKTRKNFQTSKLSIILVWTEFFKIRIYTYRFQHKCLSHSYVWI